jgi:DNA processing protein
MKKRPFLAMAHINGIGPKTLYSLESHFGDIESCFKLKKRDMQQLGFNNKLINSILNPNWDAADKALKWAEKKGNTLITWHDLTYPYLLKQIIPPPPMLFLKGNSALLSEPQLAIIGSRHPSEMGINNAYQFSNILAENGICITSGLAQGIDGAAHRGALQGIGKTIAVLGTGIENCYPARHKTLTQEIADKGLLISEFPLGTSPYAAHFPQRNRIISGLAFGVIVVEAALRSGSLITARLALEQGREVFAIPGPISNPMSKGCHFLIKQGAKLIETVADILLELPSGILVNSTINEKNKAKGLEQSLQNLVKFVDYEVTSVDTICAKSGLSPAVLATQLIDLEMKGIIKAVPGGYLRF